MVKYEPIAMIAEYAWMAHYLQFANKNCIKIIDTHDVLHLHRSSFEDAGFNENSKWTLKSELRLLNLADVLLGIQEKECQFFRDHLGEIPTVVFLPHGVQLSDNFQYKPSDGARISFIGTRQKGNFGILEFLEHAGQK